MAIQLTANEIVFLYEKMVDNITYVKVREVQAPTKADKEMYSNIYTSHIASHKQIDWNCASCVVDAVTQIYQQTAPYADKLVEAKAELKASAKKAK